MFARKTLNNDPSYIGKKYGRLTVIGFREVKTSSGHYVGWDCKCDCGNTIYGKRPSAIKSGELRSCGCLKKEQEKYNIVGKQTKHGMTDTRLYSIWCSMKRRCYNTHDAAYPHYGGKGVKVCNEWLDFEVFYDWAIRNGYADNLTIERIDIDKDYCPENCTWITLAMQTHNKGDTRKVNLNGEVMPLKTACETLGLPYKAVHLRITRYGMTFEEAISRPFADKSQSLKHLCKERGVSYSDAYYHVKYCGWTVEQALNGVRP